MKTYPVDSIRNIGLFSHGGAGKTSMTEAMLFNSNAISRLGRVEEGNTVSDWDPDEVKRTISISTSIAPVEWRDHKINVLDAPGYADFIGEVKGCIRVVDSAVILLDASAGVEVGTEYAWQFAQERELPRILVINKMDRENANFASSLESAQSLLGHAVVPLYIPIGSESSFRGVVDLLEMRAHLFADGRAGDTTDADVPAELLDEAETYRLHIVEKIAESDEELMLRYLEDEEISTDELRRALRAAVARREVVPVLVSGAAMNRGVGIVMDAIVAFAPAPGPELAKTISAAEVELNPSPDEPLAALVWKTMADPFVGKLTYFRVFSGTIRSDSHVWNTVKDKDERIGQLYVLRGKEQLPVSELTAGDIGAVAKLADTSTGDTLCDPARKAIIEGVRFPRTLFTASVMPRTKSDLDKMGAALARIIDEDPTLTIGRDPQTGETIVGGLGESHVQIALERMARKFGVNVDVGLPTVPYRETIQRAVQKVEYKHKKQTGGHGQYGHVFIDVSPTDQDFEFVESIFGGSVPRQYIPAVEKGVREAMEEGILAGFPVVNVKVTLTDGSYHNVDSSEMAFKLAASQAFKKAAQAAQPVILEPVLRIEVTVPDGYTGDVMGDLTTKRAHVTGMTPSGAGSTTIEATVPSAEVQRYATDLRSITQGRGTFTTEFSHYQQVPSHLTDAIVSAHRARQEASV
ncbi:MAG TPA: elongation factor G [Thermomicrobiales bacterium]|nr:elongation factor G [Thermomicrobiales bacterium]